MDSRDQDCVKLPVEACFDRELAAAHAGLQEHLGSLLEKYRPYLLAIAMAELPDQLGGKVGASDLVQETLIRGYENFGGFEGRSPEQLTFWLRSILLNYLHNVVKAYGAEKRDVSREQPVDSQIAQVGPASPSQWLVAREQRERFNSALSRLPAEWRRVIQWRHRENLSFEEISRRLVKSEDTARRLWARAIRQLQLELQAYESRVT
jgi:RNA polymerase sigma-70 factor, ECF subfamily